MADFMNWLDEINALAERSPGSSRLQGDNGNNTDLKVSDDPLFIVNLGVWSSIDALYDFAPTARTTRRCSSGGTNGSNGSAGRTPLWWQPAGTLPTAEEALARLDRLATLGTLDRGFHVQGALPASERWRRGRSREANGLASPDLATDAATTVLCPLATIERWSATING